jgi:hypothetical protein
LYRFATYNNRKYWFISQIDFFLARYSRLTTLNVPLVQERQVYRQLRRVRMCCAWIYYQDLPSFSHRSKHSNIVPSCLRKPRWQSCYHGS